MTKIIRNKKRSQSGFTLVELLIAIAIFAFFITLASGSLVNVLNMEQKVNVLRQTQNDARYILETIAREARGANGELDANGERLVHGYNILDGGSYFNLYLYSTNISTGTVTQVVYTYYSSSYSDASKQYTIVRYVYQKNIGGSYPSTPTSSAVLNNPNDLRITGFKCTVVSNPSDLTQPPFLKNIDLQAQSAKGIGAINPAYTASVEFETSVTSRNY